MKIETTRLTLRPWSHEDIPHYQALSLDVGYHCFSPPGCFLVRDETEAKQRIEKRVSLYRDRQLGKFPIFETCTGSFVGTCGGEPCEIDGKQEVELGYRLMLGHWGKGYATEAATAMLAYLLRERNLPCVYGFAVPQNPASIRVLEKSKMVYQRDFLWFGLPHRLYRAD